MSEENRYTIGDLERMTGVKRRTVRFYIERGVLPSSDGPGKGRHYREEHLVGLVRIQELRQQGKSLSEIKNVRPIQPTEVEGTRQGQGQRVLLAKEGVWLEVAYGVTALTSARLDRIAELCRKELGLDFGNGKRPRIMVRGRTGGARVIPHGLEGGATLKIGPGETVEIGEVTPALRRAEDQKLIEIIWA